MFISTRFLSKPGSEIDIRKYYANLRHQCANHNLLNYNRLYDSPFSIRGERAFDLLDAAFDLQ